MRNFIFNVFSWKCSQMWVIMESFWRILVKFFWHHFKSMQPIDNNFSTSGECEDDPFSREKSGNTQNNTPHRTFQMDYMGTFKMCTENCSLRTNFCWHFGLSGPVGRVLDWRSEKSLLTWILTQGVLRLLVTSWRSPLLEYHCYQMNKVIVVTWGICESFSIN